MVASGDAVEWAMPQFSSRHEIDTGGLGAIPAGASAR
jgi:hypothetical protein